MHLNFPLSSQKIEALDVASNVDDLIKASTWLASEEKLIGVSQKISFMGAREWESEFGFVWGRRDYVLESEWENERERKGGREKRINEPVGDWEKDGESVREREHL